MTGELEYLKKRGLNISYDSDEVIDDLEYELMESGNIEVDVFYKIIDLSKELTLPFHLEDKIELDENEYPIYVDYMTPEEIEDGGIDEDLKELNFVTMLITDALDLFKYQNKLIKWK